MDLTDDLSARDAKLISTPSNFLQIRECWCLLGMRLWRWRIRVNQQYGLRPSMKTWKMQIFVSFSHPLSSRSYGECEAYHLLSGTACRRWPALLQGLWQCSWEELGALHTNKHRFCQQACLGSFPWFNVGWMSAFCCKWSFICCQAGINLWSFCADIILWLPLFNPVLLLWAGLAYRLGCSMWGMKQISKTCPYPFSPLYLPVGL